MNQPSREPGGAQGPPRARSLLIALFILGCGVLFARGTYRAMTGSSGDFAMIYGSARAWLIGENPYEAAAVGHAFAAAGGDAARNPEQFGSAILLYPPSTFPLLAPIAALPWPIAVQAWAILSVGLWALTLLVVARIGGFPRGSVPWWSMLAGGIWLAPAVTNMMAGQVAVITGALIALAQFARTREEAAAPPRRGPLSGVLLGLATALKPQVAGLFAVYEAGRLRWARALTAAAIAILLAGIGIARMESAGLPWRASWTRNLADFTTTSNGDPTRANPETRHQIISLHTPIHTFMDDRAQVKLLVYATLGALCLAYFLTDLRRGRQRGEDRPELVSLCMTAVVTLLVVYHRFYDAVLLVWPLALAIDGLRRRLPARPLYLALLALIALFFAPGAVILVELAKRHLIPPALTHTQLWEALIIFHQPWALLAMAILLILIRASRPSPAPIN